MDERATELLAALRNTSLSVDAKIASLTKLKSEIKQRNVPTSAVGDIFDAIRLAIASQHASLSAGGFSALGHLLKRLYLQEQTALIASQGRHTYSLLLEKLGDHKERVRAQASQAFADFWQASPTETEHHVLEVALVGKSPRAKETSMMWLVKMTKERGVLFRAHVPSLVVGLEDADSAVRETAKAAVIELFQNAPSRAISDLKKQIQSHNVRRSITLSIFAALGINSISDADLPSSHSGMAARPGSSFSHRREEPPRPNSVLSTRSHPNQDGSGRNDDSHYGLSRPPRGDPPRKDALSHAASIESLSAVSLEPEEPVSLDPITVYSNREVDEMFRDMIPHFEGKETEHNWLHRERGVQTLRKLTKGNAPHDYQAHYLAGIKQLLDGILKAVNSLRTTLSAAGCSLVQDIARVNGPAIEPMVEILLQNLIKLCGAVKKITSQSGNITVDTIIGNISYSTRLLQHMWAACQDKNTQPRLFATGWLKTLMTRHAKQKNAIEHSGGVDLIEKCIKKGLADANPGVRENMRGTYWAFAHIWPDRARSIISELDTKSRSLLEKDSGNPNAAAHASNTTTSRSGQSQTSSATRMTLKETIAAQKKARLAAARNLPPRPESAQSTFSEQRPTRPTVHRQPASSSSVRNVATGSQLSSSTSSAQGGSLSSAPMRPAMRPRRPELMRPATADPYSRRNAPLSAQSKILSPTNSPQRSSPKTAPAPRTRNPPARPKSRMEGVTTNTIQRKAAASEPPTVQRAEPNSINLIHPEPEPEPEPVIPTSQVVEEAVMSPTKADEEFTIVLPDIISPMQVEVPQTPVSVPTAAAIESTVESPIVDPIEIPLEASVEAPSETLVEVPIESPAEAPVQAPVEEPAEILAEAPVEIPVEEPVELPTEVPREPASALDETPTETPAETPVETAIEIPVEAPIEVPANIPAAIDPTDLPNADTNLTESFIEDMPKVQPEPHKDAVVIGGQITPPRQRQLSTTPRSKIPTSPTFRQHSREITLSSPLRTPPRSHIRPSEPEISTIVKLSPPSTSADSNGTTALKVYEDPQSPISKTTTSSPTTPQTNRLVSITKPLEILPLKEPSSTNRKYNQDTQSIAPLSYSPPAPASNENSHRRWKKVEISERRRSLSPHSKDPNRAQDMIDRGLMRIRTSSLDVHGYRKFQGLIRYHETIINDEAKYSQILLALFDALESPDGDKVSSTSRSFDLKTQILFTIRLMLSQNREHFSKFYSRAMISIIKTRKHYDITNHIVSGLEETSEDIVRACNPQEVVDAILDLLETEEKSPESSRMVSMGTYVLCGLLHRLNDKKLYFSDPELERLGKFASENLRNPQPDVRRAVMDFCLELHEMAKPEEKFWSIVNSPGEDVRPLLTYYIMRKPKT
ncbi:suppressor of tub2 mutation [Microsporum canis]|uniref:Stu1 n=1 Tax=Arthroderma otae (strain ATCC MYA-4605 / CBS 113480) TaxID=554155 RepID=C5FHN4_ARTOC|nr:stu1 [Microsporum canis CBS 113480]EEQ28864.1 stu1 [Microsporum canis CBS 113480]